MACTLGHAAAFEGQHGFQLTWTRSCEKFFGRSYDLLCTTFFHFQEMADRLQSSAEIVPIHHTPSHQSILDVASLPRGVTVEIVCPNQRTLDRIESMVRTYIQANVLACTIEDHAALKRIAAHADVIVDTDTSQKQFSRARPKWQRLW